MAPSPSGVSFTQVAKGRIDQEQRHVAVGGVAWAQVELREQDNAGEELPIIIGLLNQEQKRVVDRDLIP